ELAVLRIPDANGFILAGGGDQLAVLVEYNGVYRVGMTLERHLLLAGGEVPQLDGVVETGGGQRLAVRAEGHAEHQPLVPLELGWRLRQGDGCDGEAAEGDE